MFRQGFLAYRGPFRLWLADDDAFPDLPPGTEELFEASVLENAFRELELKSLVGKKSLARALRVGSVRLTPFYEKWDMDSWKETYETH